MKTTKLLLVLLAIALGASAQKLVCPPNFAVDSQPVSPACPGLGQEVLAIPDSAWLLAWNDNPGNYAPGIGQPGCTYTPGGGCDDFDFNDVMEMVLINHLGNEAHVFFVNPFSGWNDSVQYQGAPLFFNDVIEPTPKLIYTTPYQEVALQIVTPDGHTFNQGIAANSDGAIHAWVQQIGTLPPPTTASFGGASIALLGLFTWRKRRA